MDRDQFYQVVVEFDTKIREVLPLAMINHNSDFDKTFYSWDINIGAQSFTVILAIDPKQRNECVSTMYGTGFIIEYRLSGFGIKKENIWRLVRHIKVLINAEMNMWRD